MKRTTLTIITILTAFLINAQTTITGTVSDYTGPLPFANVVIEGTDSGTVADAKGDFSIETNTGDILTISYVGFMPKHITIENTKHLEVSLDMESLDEVVIVGYGTTSCTRTLRCYGSLRAIETSSLGITRASTTNNNMVYPNPTSTGYVTLDMREQYTSLEMSVHSITGQRIIHQTYNQPKERLSVDLSGFSTGVYIINIIANGEPLPTQKVIRS